MNAYLLPTIEFGPRIVQRLLAYMPDDRLDVPLHPERFTAREVIAHLADWEPIMRERIRMAVSQPGSTVPAYDEGQMAIDHRYAEADPQEQVRILIRERAVTAALLRSLQPGDWSQSVLHPERGPQSAEDLANLLLGHDLYHIEQLTEYLAARAPR
jgi:hypothetical protein